MHMSTKHATAAAGLLTLLVTGAACTSGGHGAASKLKPKPVDSSSATVQVAPKRPVPSSVPNQVAARKAVAVTDCAATPGGWRAAGTLTNPGGAEARYVVTVFFTNAGSTVIGYGSKTVVAPSGKAVKWAIEDSTVHASQARCVLRGVAVK